MKKNIYLVTGAVVLLLVGTLLFSGNSEIDKVTESDFNTDNGVKCTRIVGMGTAGSSEGTIYFFKDIVRYDSTITHQELGQRNMHLIITKDKSYAWGSAMDIPGMQNGGMVFDNEEGSDFTPPELSEIEELKKRNFKVPGMDCEEWAPDQDMLTPPKDIKFFTQEELMNNMMAGFMPGKNPNSTPGMPMNLDCDEMCKMIPDKNQKEECQKQCNQK